MTRSFGRQTLHHVARDLFGTGREGNRRLTLGHARAHDARSKQLQSHAGARRGSRPARHRAGRARPSRRRRGRRCDGRGSTATEDITRIRPWPWSTRRRRTSASAATGQAKLTSATLRRGRGVVFLGELVAEQSHGDDHEVDVPPTFSKASVTTRSASATSSASKITVSVVLAP